ncbi:MAG: HDOD domain-containing protein [Candidatus Eremiobacterota bacterium]
MEVEIFIDKRKNKLRRRFKEDFKILCPFCSSLNKYVINTGKDLYCKNCNELLVFVPDISSIDGNKEGDKSNVSEVRPVKEEKKSHIISSEDRPLKEEKKIQTAASEGRAISQLLQEKKLSQEARPVKIEERDFSNMEIGSHEKAKNENIKKIKVTIEELKRRDFSFLSLLFASDTFNIDERDFNKVSAMIKYDPAISSKIIQIAKSPAYGFYKQELTLNTAVTVLGVKKAGEIIGISANRDLFKSVRNTELYRQICYHSLGVGIFAKLLSPHMDLSEDEMFMIGIMHDVGKIILYISMPVEYEELINITREDFIPVIDAERKYMNIDHCEVGKIAMSEWNYRKQFIDTASYHHGLEFVEDKELHKMLLCIQASNILCNLAKIGNIKNIRTMKFELFDKKTKEMMKGVSIPKIMLQAGQEINNLQLMFGVKNIVTMTKSP